MTDEIHRIRFVVGYDEITLYMHVEHLDVPYWAVAATYPLHSPQEPLRDIDVHIGLHEQKNVWKGVYFQP